jgi:hypothetical protein
MRAGFLLRQKEPGLYTPYGHIQGVYALENDPVTVIGRLLHSLGLYQGHTANQFIRDVHSARAADTTYVDWRSPEWIISGSGMLDRDSGKQRDCMIHDGDFTPRPMFPVGNGVGKIMEI